MRREIRLDKMHGKYLERFADFEALDAGSRWEILIGLICMVETNACLDYEHWYSIPSSVTSSELDVSDLGVAKERAVNPRMSGRTHYSGNLCD